MAVVTLTEGLCFRGEGKCHFVVGFQRATGRYVWRIQKNGGADFDVIDNCKFLCVHVLPMFPQRFIVKPRLVRLHASGLKDLSSRIGAPMVNYLRSVDTVWAVEMEDLCFFPGQGVRSSQATVAVELKPKQGHFHSTLASVSPYCSNCLLQMIKHKSGVYEEMYDFCPLDLFSADYQRVLKAVRALLKTPHANLKIFKNGHTVLAHGRVPDCSESVDTLLKHACTNSDSVSFAEVLSKLLISEADESVFSQILYVQKLDRLGPIGIAKWLKDKFSAIPEMETANDWFKLLDAVDDRQIRTLALHSLIAASIRDCSLIVTMEIVQEATVGERVLRLNCGCQLAYTIRVIDIDIKSPKKMVRYGQRLLDAIESISNCQSFQKMRVCIDRIQ